MARPARQVALILARDLASQLSTPMFIVDTEGTVIYFNEPAEAILGKTWAETGELSAEEWGTIFRQRTLEGEPLPREQIPLSIALAEKRPAHTSLRITGMDGVEHTISSTAIPLMAHPDEIVGAVAIFWVTD
ncbi:MAG TPA: PAS domain-containing protein [Actinomycetota bacterium]